ncbi:hypothetical protein YC2023_074970 [Brassica napus]
MMLLAYLANLNWFVSQTFKKKNRGDSNPSLKNKSPEKPHKDGISSFPNSSILHSVYQSSSSPPNPKPRSLLERRLRLIIISARPRKPLNFTPSCVSSDPNASDSIKRDECTIVIKVLGFNPSPYTKL